MSLEVYQHPEAINAIYFLLKHAYLTNNTAQAEFMTKCMKKALTTQSKETICQALTALQMKDLKNLIYSVENKIYYCDFGIQENNPGDLINRIIGNVDSSMWYEEEKELEDKLCDPQWFAQLNQTLGLNMTFYDRQYVTVYGKIDMLAKHDRTIYIIELKKDVADHKLVGQVLKYALHFQKRLIYNLYDEIKIITIAGNYSDYTYDQLKMMGASMLTYTIKDGVFGLQVV